VHACVRMCHGACVYFHRLCGNQLGVQPVASSLGSYDFYGDM